MMNKEEVKAMIAETIKANNKKAITAQSMANCLTAMVDASGEGGGGAELLKLRYRWNEELTEEDKTINAATIARFADGGGYIPYIEGADNEKIQIQAWNYFEGEGEGLVVLAGGNALYVSAIEFFNDGSAKMLINVPLGSTLLTLEEGDTYSTLKQKLRECGVEPFSELWPTIFIVDLIGAYHGWVTPGLLWEDVMIVLTYTAPDGVIYMIAAVAEGLITEHDFLEHAILCNAEIYLGVDASNTDYIDFNKRVFSEHSLIDAIPSTFRLRISSAGNEYYSPISAKTKSTDGVTEYYEVVIYCNNTFETWRIYRDGTSSLVTE